MVFFGHLGLTTGAIKLYDKIGGENADNTPIDYRAVLVAAVLPDIIDKPIGAILFRSTFHNSRIIAHTLLFSLILILIGYIRVKKRKKNTVLITGVCCIIHLILDSMWHYIDILFWPLYGLKFPERPEGDWALQTLTNLVTNPYTYIPEIIGFIILAYFFIRLIKNKKLKNFIRHGKL